MFRSQCIFCDIARGKSNTILELQTDEFVIFKDIRPASQHHYLLITKKHYESLKVLNKSHTKMVLRMEQVMKDFFRSKDICTTDALYGFHMPPLISVKHLHLHGISPGSGLNSPTAAIRFDPAADWFKCAQEAVDYLNVK